MPEEIKDIHSEDLIIDKDTMISVNDSSVKNFNLQNFINDLKNNENLLRNLKNQGFLKHSWNSITGKNTNTIIDSLDLNNQFIKFSLFINSKIVENASIINENQKEINKANKKIIENQTKIDSTDEGLKIATEKFNENVKRVDELDERLNKFYADLESLEKIKGEIKSDISVMRENYTSLESNVLEKVQYFYDNTDNAVKSIYEKQNSNSETMEDLVHAMNEYNSKIKVLTNDFNNHATEYLKHRSKQNKFFYSFLFLFLFFSTFILIYLFYPS